jgi:hypothetical protein
LEDTTSLNLVKVLVQIQLGGLEFCSLSLNPYICAMICKICNVDKDKELFSWKNKTKGVKHKRCKECVSKLVKKHYLANKDKYKQKAKKLNPLYVERNKSFALNYLKENPCIDCGETDPIVLDFDHVRGKKEDNVANMIRQAISLDIIKEEIKKCEVRCANCHRRKTAKERNSYKWRVN